MRLIYEHLPSQGKRAFSVAHSPRIDGLFLLFMTLVPQTVLWLPQSMGYVTQ